MFIVIHTVTGHRSFHTATLPYIIESLDFKNESCGLSNTTRHLVVSLEHSIPLSLFMLIVIAETNVQVMYQDVQDCHTATLPYIIESLDFKNESCGLSNSVIYRGIYPSLRKRH
jgi:hypothetical protein